MLMKRATNSSTKFSIPEEITLVSASVIKQMADFRQANDLAIGKDPVSVIESETTLSKNPATK